jgi:membrane protein YqaA with SNARE-associated domain
VTVSALPAGPIGIALATFLYCLAGALVPAFNIEAYLLAVSAARPGTDRAAVLLAATLGQMCGKSLLYLAGAGMLRLPSWRDTERVREAAARLGRARCGATALTVLSALTGVPPFYAVSVAAGALRLRFAAFLAAGCCAVLVRFSAVLALGGLLTP